MNFMNGLTILVAISLVGMAQPMVENGESSQENYSSIVNNVLNNFLNSLKSILVNVTLPDLDEEFTTSKFNLSAKLENFKVLNPEKFNVVYMDTSLIPIQVENLTLKWDNVSVTGTYDVNGTVLLEDVQNLKKFFGSGNTSVTLHEVIFSVGARFDLVNGGLQISKKGIGHFDLSINRANVTVGTLMGNPDLSDLVSVFLSHAIPDFVNALTKPVFEALQDVIIDLVNGMLKG